MASKYLNDGLELIHPISSRENIISKQSLFSIRTGEIDNYYTVDLQITQSSYLISDHTHYCLNCKDWYPSKKSVFECKLRHATITHTQHVTYCA